MEHNWMKLSSRLSSPKQNPQVVSRRVFDFRNQNFFSVTVHQLDIQDTVLKKDMEIFKSFLGRALHSSFNKELYELKFVADGFSFLDLHVQQAEKDVKDPYYQPFFPTEGGTVPYPVALQDREDPISLAQRILDLYLSDALPAIATKGDDEDDFLDAIQYDFECLKALSSRVHYSKMAAEFKFRRHTKAFIAASKGLEMKVKWLKLLTSPILYDAIERWMVDEASKNGKGKIPSESFARNGTIFRDGVIPLIKEVQVNYLLRRVS